MKKISEATRKEVSTVAVMHNGKMLMGKRRDNDKWTAPGGHLEKGEKPLDGAVRELYEESGIKADPKDLKFIRTIKNPENGYIVHGYRYDIDERASTSMKQDPDGEVYRWYYKDTKTIPDSELHVPRNVGNVLLPELEKTAFEKGFEKAAAAKASKEKKNHAVPTLVAGGAGGILGAGIASNKDDMRRRIFESRSVHADHSAKNYAEAAKREGGLSKEQLKRQSKAFRHSKAYASLADKAKKTAIKKGLLGGALGATAAGILTYAGLKASDTEKTGTSKVRIIRSAMRELEDAIPGLAQNNNFIDYTHGKYQERKKGKGQLYTKKDLASRK